MSDRLSDLNQLPLFFDRRQPSHPWQRAFQDLAKDQDESWRMVCQNWRMAHNVSREREAALTEAPEFSRGLDGKAWKKARQSHFRRTLCRPALPSTAYEESGYRQGENQNNVIPRRTVVPHEQLVHVGSLNRILAHLAKGEVVNGPFRLDFDELTHELALAPAAAKDAHQFSAEVDAIAHARNRAGRSAVRELAGLLCEALGPTEPPWWATFASEVTPLLQAQDATGLCRALGLGHLEAGQWLLIWHYEVRVLETLIPGAPSLLTRPTVVEAEKNPCHHPPYPGATFGITMPLDESATQAHREVLHPPLRGPAAVDYCTGTLLQIAESPLPDHAKLEGLRERHRRRLEAQDPLGDAAAWLERHRES